MGKNWWQSPTRGVGHSPTRGVDTDPKPLPHLDLACAPGPVIWTRTGSRPTGRLGNNVAPCSDSDHGHGARAAAFPRRLDADRGPAGACPRPGVVRLEPCLGPRPCGVCALPDCPQPTTGRQLRRRCMPPSPVIAGSPPPASSHQPTPFMLRVAATAPLPHHLPGAAAPEAPQSRQTIPGGS